METKTIRELCDIVVDCPHSTPKWTTSGKIVIRNNNIKKGRIDFSSPSYTDDEHFNLRVKRAIPRSGDIIITREAPMGEVGMIPEKLHISEWQLPHILSLSYRLLPLPCFPFP